MEVVIIAYIMGLNRFDYFSKTMERSCIFLLWYCLQKLDDLCYTNVLPILNLSLFRQ